MISRLSLVDLLDADFLWCIYFSQHFFFNLSKLIINLYVLVAKCVKMQYFSYFLLDAQEDTPTCF